VPKNVSRAAANGQAPPELSARHAFAARSERGTAGNKGREAPDVPDSNTYCPSLKVRSVGEELESPMTVTEEGKPEAPLMLQAASP
jgi:hypothetical protein